MTLHNDFAKLANQLKALDNEEKLRILYLLTVGGQKSITDISRELSINFSTAHKYLEQLEAAELVQSKSIKEDRLKRLFAVRDFNIALSPSAFLKKKPMDLTVYSNLKILNSQSEGEKFEVHKLIDAGLRQSIPVAFIEEGLQELSSKINEWTSIVELEYAFNNYLINKQKILNEAVGSFNSQGLFKPDTYCYLLKKRGYSEILRKMVDGEIHISNLGKAKMLAFSHDLHVISLFGFKDIPVDFKDLLHQIMDLLNESKEISFPPYALDSFNYFIAPYIKNLSDNDVYELLLKFFQEVKNAELPISLGIDIGTPRFIQFLKTFPNVSYEERRSLMLSILQSDQEKDTVPYMEYQKEAQRVAQIILKIHREQALFNPIFKLWKDWKIFLPEIESNLSVNTYIANMLPAWQGTNASYMSSTRFDSRWKYWYRCVRVGEVQSIALNLPRIALETRNKDLFIEKLKHLLDSSYGALLFGAEIVSNTIYNKDLTITKKQTHRGQYIHLDDSLYTISLCGLREAVEILSGGPLELNISLANEILDYCAKFAKNKSEALLRLDIKENSNPAVAKRFYSIDSRRYNLPMKEYSCGVSDRSNEVVLALQEKLLGGHCASIPLKEFNFNLLSKSWGLIKLV